MIACAMLRLTARFFSLASASPSSSMSIPIKLRAPFSFLKKGISYEKAILFTRMGSVRVRFRRDSVPLEGVLELVWAVVTLPARLLRAPGRV